MIINQLEVELLSFIYSLNSELTENRSQKKNIAIRHKFQSALLSALIKFHYPKPTLH